MRRGTGIASLAGLCVLLGGCGQEKQPPSAPPKAAPKSVERGQIESTGADVKGRPGKSGETGFQRGP